MVASAIINKKLGKSSDYLSLPLFGKWQTEKYKPAKATNGIVNISNIYYFSTVVFLFLE